MAYNNTVLGTRFCMSCRITKPKKNGHEVEINRLRYYWICNECALKRKERLAQGYKQT